MRRVLVLAKPYWPQLLAAVLLMTGVGLMQGLMARLIQPVFDRVLQPQSVEQPVLLFEWPRWSTVAATVRMTGRVTDDAGAPVQRAQVTVANEKWKTKQSTATDAEGRYALPLAAPGKYRMTVAVAGFKRHLHEGIQLRAGEAPRVDVALEAGAASETVSIRGPVETLRTDRSLHGGIYLNDLLPSSIQNVWTMVAVTILTVFFLKGLFDYFGNYLINFVGLSVVTDLRQRVFDHVLRQDAGFFSANSTGRLMSSIMNDIEKIQVATSHILADFLRQIFTAIFLLAVLMQQDARLAVVSLTLLPFVFIPTARLGKRLRRTTRRAQDNAADLNEVLQETLSGQQVVKAFGAERLESERFARTAAQLKRANLKYVLQQALASPIIEFFAAVTIVVLLTYARSQIKVNQMTAGEFSSFMVALLMLYEPVKRLTGIHQIFQQASGASQKVFEYLDLERNLADKAGAPRMRPFQNAITFKAARFRYPTAERYALDGVDLTVKAGEVCALVGPSGAGKTTLASLVLRFYDLESGVLSVDGMDVRDVQIASLRQQIGLVAQETFLFNDTILNNIRYGRPDATAG